MKKLIILLILLSAVLFTAGCTEGPKENVTNSSELPKNSTSSQGIQENSMTSQEIQKKSAVVEVTQLEQINTSLQEGPVLVKIGAEWCGPCQAMKPILKDLAAEYSGKITVMSIDIDQSPDLTTYFEIGYIPDTFLIVGIEKGKYVYMQEDGKVSMDRLQARILGQMEKEVYEKLIDVALLQEEKNTSK
ncbi:MAG: thioredoxin family protein [Methanosarcina sp.]|uniref:thioredoxin family protein n=1 Tax=Methanosarcina sp. TaxID=2213 RepID=UPI003BB76C81